MKRFKTIMLFGIMLLGLTMAPLAMQAQGISEGAGGLQAVLDRVYDEMIPLCAQITGVGRLIAGFGALWYIASRIWKSIASAEPIDFYPLLRPFALGLAIMLFPAILGVMNGVLGTTVTGTAGMVKDSDRAIKDLLILKEQELKKSARWKLYVGDDGRGDREAWYKYTHPDDPDAQNENWVEGLGNDFRFWADKADYKMRHSFKQFMSEVLQLIYQAASLCINTLRTFFLIVLGILGPVVLGFAVYDGLQHTLTVWIARYINIFLWLPIANIFGAILGKIQQNMIKLDISEVQQNGDTLFSSTDTAYFIFLMIGILGYFSVPTVANYIVHAGGGNAMLSRMNSLALGVAGAGKQAVSTGTSGAGQGAGMIVDRFDDARRGLTHGMAEGSGQDYFKDKLSGNSKA